jgi:hypothetical protein
MNAVFLVLSCSRTSSLLHHRVRDADAETARLVVDATTLVDATTRLVHTNVVSSSSNAHREPRARTRASSSSSSIVQHWLDIPPVETSRRV